MVEPGLKIPVVCKACRKATNFQMLRTAQPVLDRLLSTAPPQMAIGVLRHRCGADFLVTIEDLRNHHVAA